MILLFDSNIVLHYLRESSIKVFIEQNFSPFGPGQETVLSVVSIGELRSIAVQNNWGEKRKLKLEQLFREFIIADINSEDVLNRYAEIDAFSQNKLQQNPLGLTSRNMGKNDLWVAATASVLHATFLTTDADFDHLKGAYLEVEKII